MSCNCGATKIHLTEEGCIKGCNSAILQNAQHLLGRKELGMMLQDIAHSSVDIEFAEVVGLGSDSHGGLGVLALPHQQVPHLQEEHHVCYRRVTYELSKVYLL